MLLSSTSVVALLAVAGITLAALKFMKYLRKWRLLKKIPKPDLVPYHWFLGHIPAFSKLDENFLWYAVREMEASPQKSRSLALNVFAFTSIVSIFHSKYVAAIHKEPKTNVVYNIVKPWLGEGLLVAQGEKWLRNRKLLTPAFHCEILKGYVQVYNSCLSLLLNKWSVSAQEEQQVMLFDSLSLMSLDIIMQTTLSYQSNCQIVTDQQPYVKACSNLVYFCTDRFMNPLYMIDCIYWYTPHGRKTRAMCDLVHRHAENIIAERRKSLTVEKEEEDKGIGRESRKYFDFLDILLMARDEEGQGLSDLEIRNEVDTFMFEGHDTTAIGMSWSLYCLAKHPQHQDKIRQEVRSVLKGRRQLEYEDLKHLNYTTWCIKEAMRLYPPVFSFFRKTNQEMNLGEYTIPQDTILGVNVFAIHRNPTIWENPAEYNPLRLSPEESVGRGPYDYIPFSAGRRNCIAQNLAMNEMKVVIATLVNHFILEVDESHPVEMSPWIVLRAKNDIKLFVKSCE